MGEASFGGQDLPAATPTARGSWQTSKTVSTPAGRTIKNQSISTNTPLKYNFVTAIVVGDTAEHNSGKGRFALYGGDATSGPLKTLYDGVRPNKPGYNPTQKQGSIILGTGGDNSNGDGGQWFEGVMASGAAARATLNGLQANIVAAGYGK